MRRLRNRYRLVILKDNDLAEKASFSIRGFNVVAFFSVVLLITFLLFWALFSYTPLVYFLPVSNQLKKERKLTQLARRADSLNKVIKDQQVYFDNIQTVLKGQVPESDKSRMKPTPETLKNRSSQLQAQNDLNTDSLLKGTKVSREGYSFLSSESAQRKFNTPLEAINFFPPLKGVVTNDYNTTENHFAIDVVAPANTTIKAAKGGTVIYTGWSATTGHTMILQHNHNLLSVYKHNSELLKDIGSFVKAGEAIGVVGTSGKLSTGPHLHFELWKAGTPLNPSTYIDFD